MSKLSPNQAAAVQALADLCAKTGATCASGGQWKKAAPEGVTVSSKSLVKAGAVTLIRAKNRDSEKLSDLYAPNPQG